MLQRMILVFICLFLSLELYAKPSSDISLENKLWSVTVHPQTLSVTAKPSGSEQILLSRAQGDLGSIGELRQTANKLSFFYTKQNINVEMILEQNVLDIQFTANRPTSFIWPVIQGQSPIDALILPRDEGIYLPLDNERWINQLVSEGAWNTLEQLSMPFWGFDCDSYILTWIATNPYNNSLTFTKNNSILQIEFAHQFAQFSQKKTYGFRILLNKTSSPVEPAKQFRQYIQAKNQHVSLKEKAQSVPRVNRLLGAAHAYLWGDGLISKNNIPSAKWKPLCREFINESKAAKPSPGKRIKELMTGEKWQEVVNLVNDEWPNNYQKNEIATGLHEILSRRDFYKKDFFPTAKQIKPSVQNIETWCSSAPIADVCAFNCELLAKSFPGYFTARDKWGNGVSINMLDTLLQDGLDRMRLCLAGWEGVEKNPSVARKADEMGYLFGTYDSFHSIHDPALKGSDDSWETAQFDQALYDNGRIMKRDGTYHKGFKGVGGKLSPIAARPYVEKRVRRNMKNVPYSYYFIDCDAVGECYDDFSPTHKVGQREDIQSRIDRLNWISETFKVPIGSEGGCYLFAGTIHVSEGIFGPYFGWGDPDLKDRNSPYYLGGYYPPDNPAIFSKQVSIKEKYQFFQYNPRFRLPLYEIVYHDSVVTTHHWSYGSLKFKDILDTVELTELLYLVPPLYHLNLDEYTKHCKTIKKHYDFFSPLHREYGFAPMTDFKWLSQDRLVQQCTFDNNLYMIANYSQWPFKFDALNIPARSILMHNNITMESKIYTP